MAATKTSALRKGFLSNYIYTNDLSVFRSNMQSTGENKFGWIAFGPDIYIGEITNFGFNTSNGRYKTNSTIYSFEELFVAIDEMFRDLYERAVALNA